LKGNGILSGKMQQKKQGRKNRKYFPSLPIPLKSSGVD